MYYSIFIPIALAVIYATYLIGWLKRQPAGNEEMQKYQSNPSGIHMRMLTGSTDSRHCGCVLIVVIGVFLNWISALGFLIGAVASAFADILVWMSRLPQTAKLQRRRAKDFRPLFRSRSKQDHNGILVVSLRTPRSCGFLFCNRAECRSAYWIGIWRELDFNFCAVRRGYLYKAADVEPI